MKTYQFSTTSTAEFDVEDAADWYHRKSPALGKDFLDEVESTLGLVARNPYAFQQMRRKPDVRRALTQRFPYRVFFVVNDESVVVFRVLHNSRDDREWKRAIPKL